MSTFSDSLTDFLFPQKYRGHWTFRNATAIALLASIATACMRAFVRFPREQIARLEQQHVFRSPLFLGLYYIFLASVLWLIYATRHRETWYLWRVFVFAMVLAGALIGLVDIILSLRAY